MLSLELSRKLSLTFSPSIVAYNKLSYQQYQIKVIDIF